MPTHIIILWYSTFTQIYTHWPDRNAVLASRQCLLHIIDYVRSLNNSRFDFVDRIYPLELEIRDITDTDRYASYLDLHLEINSEGRLRTNRQKDYFNFPTVNFPFLHSNITAAPAYEVYISQLMRFARACSSYYDFFDIGLQIRRLLNQGFLLVKLTSSLRNIYGRHHDLVDHIEIFVSQLTTDMFHLSKTLPGPFLVHDLSPGV